jgi:hypothetical protein
MAELEITNVEELKSELEKAVKDNPNKPTEEEIKLAGEEFEYASKIFPTKMWEIGEVKDARLFCDYLSHYVKNRLFWTKNGWMGVVKLEEELRAAEILLNGKEPLKLGYQALEFVYFSLMNPGGVGLQSALDFETEGEQYIPLMEAVSITLEKARVELKTIQFLQDKYTAMQQGFYLELEPPDAEPIPEEAPVIGDAVNIGTQEIDLSAEPLPGDLGDLTIHPAEPVQ